MNPGQPVGPPNSFCRGDGPRAARHVAPDDKNRRHFGEASGPLLLRKGEKQRRNWSGKKNGEKKIGQITRDNEPRMGLPI